MPISSPGPTSRAGSSTTRPPTVTRPARTISSAPRREATPAVARNLARRMRCHHRAHGSEAAGANPERVRPARIPARPGLAMGGAGRGWFFIDDQPAPGRPRGADRGGAVLDPDSRERGARLRRNRQGAVCHPRRPPGRGGLDDLSRRPAVAVPVLAVWLPADLQLLRHWRNALRAQPERLRDPGPGS